MPGMITAKELSYSYIQDGQETKVFENVDLDIDEGSFVVNFI